MKIEIGKKDFAQLPIEGIHYVMSTTDINSGKMHGQKGNKKTIGYVIIEAAGKQGISEVYISTYVSFSLSSIFDYLNKLFNGKSIKNVYESINDFHIPFVTRNGIYRACIGCLENALLDLIARLEKKPLYKILSQNSKFPKLYASGGTVIYTPNEIEEESRVVMDSGFEGYKIRVGRKNWPEDKDRIAAIIDDVSLDKMVDAISGTRKPHWSLEEAENALPYLEDQGVYWLEEPLYPDNFREHKKLQSMTSIHIAAGEAYSGYGEYENLINVGNIDVIQFDACHSGGISICHDIFNLAKSNNKKCAIHVWGSLVSQLTNFHLALSLIDLDYLEVPLVGLDINSKLYSQDLSDIRKLFKSVIDRPGIGIPQSDFKNILQNFEYGYEYKW